MKCSEYENIRIKLREYRILRDELDYRTKYILNFKKTLIHPLPKTEKTLLKIYERIIEDMENNALKLSLRLERIESIISKLSGPERNVIYLRYIEGIDWITMPEHMMYEQRTCQLFEKKALQRIMKMNLIWED